VYRVVLNVGGPAGTGAAALAIDARNLRGEGYGSCSNLAFGAGGLAAAAIAALATRRRRR
jgi:hypothetical protein